MRNQPRHKWGIGLTLALAATALSGTGVMAFPAPADTTPVGAESIVPPDSTTPLPGVSSPVTDIILTSPETGRNIRLPTFAATMEVAPAAPDAIHILILLSPETGRNVRLPAF
jgi:hypothetical protein